VGGAANVDDEAEEKITGDTAGALHVKSSPLTFGCELHINEENSGRHGSVGEDVGNINVESAAFVV